MEGSFSLQKTTKILENKKKVNMTGTAQYTY